jgi:SAM-dependent methyltransferase
VTATAREHYDQFPYDVGVDDSEVYARPDTPLGGFLASLRGGSVLDVGCGPGNALVALARRAGRAVGVDVSERTLSLARERLRAAACAAEVQQGDALALPFPDASFDHVVAAGSLHHTGDAARGFRELVRVLKPGGSGFVAVYARPSYYQRLYRTVGALARRVRSSAVADRVLNRALLLPLFAVYFVGGRAVLHRQLPRLSWTQVRNYFADQLLNPVVSFHDEAEIAGWARDLGVVVQEARRTHAGALLNVRFERPR